MEMTPIINFPATQPVSAASLPLPAGASTEATLAALREAADSLVTLANALLAFVGPSANVDGSVRSTVAGGTLPAVTTVTSLTYLSGLGNAAYSINPAFVFQTHGNDLNQVAFDSLRSKITLS